MNRFDATAFPLADENREILDRFQTNRLTSSIPSSDIPLYELPAEMDELLMDSEFNPLGLGRGEV